MFGRTILHSIIKQLVLLWSLFYFSSSALHHDIFFKKSYLLSLPINEWEATLPEVTFNGLKSMYARNIHACWMNYRKNNVMLHCTCLNKRIIYWFLNLPKKLPSSIDTFRFIIENKFCSVNIYFRGNFLYNKPSWIVLFKGNVEFIDNQKVEFKKVFFVVQQGDYIY